jgi:hypothetical protein
MTVFVIDCDPAVTAEQRAELVKGLPHDKAEVIQQIAQVDPVIIGAIALILTFPARSFFDAFFSELGKDSYGWLKTKLNLAKAKMVKPLKVEYRIHVGEILFVDDTQEWVARRHERVLGAVDTVYRCLSAEELWNIRCVKLIFDVEKNDYTEARLFNRDYERLQVAGDYQIQAIRVYRL